MRRPMPKSGCCACLRTAPMLSLKCRYMAKAFRKAGVNTQGKPLSRRVIEDAGEDTLLIIAKLIDTHQSVSLFYLAGVRAIPSEF